jgi:integrase
VLRTPVSKSGRRRTIALNTSPRDAACPDIFPTRLVGISYPWYRIRRRAGLADAGLPDLRHSFASLLVNRGVSLYVVQGLLVHASPRMTQRYAHLAPQTFVGRGRGGGRLRYTYDRNSLDAAEISG